MTFNLTQLLFLAGQADLLLKLWYRVFFLSTTGLPLHSATATRNHVWILLPLYIQCI